MKRFLLLELDDAAAPMTVTPTLDCVRDATGHCWYIDLDGGRIISEDDIGRKESSVDLIKAIAVAAHRDAAVAAITQEGNFDGE